MEILSQRLEIRLSPDLLARMQRIKDNSGGELSLGSIIRTALQSHVKRSESLQASRLRKAARKAAVSQSWRP